MWWFLSSLHSSHSAGGSQTVSTSQSNQPNEPAGTAEGRRKIPTKHNIASIATANMSSNTSPNDADAFLAAAADQLASMSLGGGGAEPAPNVETNKFCSNCGKTGDDLKGCNSCRCIRYCSASCQKKHWKHHKADCRRIKAVLSDKTRTEDACFDLAEARPDSSGLFDEPPPRPDCAICMLPMPLDTSMHAYATCCGMITCQACNVETQVAKHKLNKKRAQKNQASLTRCCEFCRTPLPVSPNSEEDVRRIKDRVEKTNDLEAIWQLAITYRGGLRGEAVNEQKALELSKRAADLGSDKAQYHLGLDYDKGRFGLEVDKEKARVLWESAAKGGNVKARFTLGGTEFLKGNIIDGIRHWQLAAASGHDQAMDALIFHFEEGLLCHRDLAKSLQARDKARLDMRSDSRDRYLALRKAGFPV